MATKTEKLIRHQRRRGGVLVPLLEDLFMKPVEVEDEEDVNFINDLLMRQLNRSQDREHRPLYSPSQLASCLRYVYLLKHHKEFGLVRAKIGRPEPHYYFFTGNFLHLKWQFALHKLDRALPDSVFKLIGVEIPIVSKRGDHGGTVDAIVIIYGVPYIIDFKGLNVRTFGEITRGYIPEDYAIQLADYMMLHNAQRKPTYEITQALLIAESKGGPDTKHLIALHETAVEISTHLPEVRRRLEVLRSNGEADSIPEIECEGTGTFQFQGCPFRKFCKEEVQKKQRERRDAESKDTARLTVAVPTGRRNNRSRGNSKRRG